ncbi:sodium:proton antiporter NhaD [Croceimicrobium hydrocarbonivorans]|uniref:Sodium:proton antiporter NhaD n=1 Tax=Croceimicrobium hydrocarbonivorans TaxID=2761580 RepID=A0A7H0VJV8_9FLAO|nr:sodium:proton antiporter NhaD [Croceimicrobium hydrocarbonivorans]
MYSLMVVVFVLGYLAIALEHNIKIDKAASALMTGTICWALYVIGAEGIIDFHSVPHWISDMFAEEKNITDQHEIVTHYVTEFQILEHLGEIASILFFLMGAMTIVELVDAHEGFSVITDRIKTTSRRSLLWIICILTFFFSAALDNLTTSIVMVSLLRKLIDDKKDRWLFAGMVVIAANAGGAWSPIGDVTTTMLWIGGQISAGAVIIKLILPSLIALIVPLIVLTPRMKGNVTRPRKAEGKEHFVNPTTERERNIVFGVGVGGLLFVPLFKTYTHLPPFMGMMLSLSVLWMITEIMHRSKNRETKSKLSVIGVLRKIDTASVLFFLGILLAVASLQSAGQLGALANTLDNNIGTGTETGVYSVGVIIGLLSAIVDNVPLVAASMGMYDIDPTMGGLFASDGLFWEFLAYCAGTGGSALIIGSAAGVAVMGLESISFGWYLKKISILAIIGYFAGAATYIIQESIFHL